MSHRVFDNVFHNGWCFHHQTKLNSSVIKVYGPNVMNNNYGENRVVNFVDRLQTTTIWKIWACWLAERDRIWDLWGWWGRWGKESSESELKTWFNVSSYLEKSVYFTTYTLPGYLNTVNWQQKILLWLTQQHWDLFFALVCVRMLCDEFCCCREEGKITQLRNSNDAMMWRFVYFH